MMFVLSKVLQFLLDPLLWILVLLLLTLFVQDQRRKRRLLRITILFFFLATNRFLSNEMARIWEFKPREVDSTIVYKGGIVLGGIGYYDSEYQCFIFRDGADRLTQAVRLYKTGKIQKIIFTGGSGFLNDSMQTEGVYVHRYLKNLQIPEDDMIFEYESRNTHENAKYTSVLLKKLKLDQERFLLITSCNHMLRARGCFNHVKIETDPYPVDRIATKRVYSLEALFLPNQEALGIWRQILHEVFGYVTYKMAGYI